MTAFQRDLGGGWTATPGILNGQPRLLLTWDDEDEEGPHLIAYVRAGSVVGAAIDLEHGSPCPVRVMVAFLDSYREWSLQQPEGSPDRRTVAVGARGERGDMSDYDPHRVCGQCGQPSPRVAICGECEVSNRDAERHEKELQAKHDKLVEVADKLRATEAELQRFREREPLVQGFIKRCQECTTCDVPDEMCIACAESFSQLRDFQLVEHIPGKPNDSQELPGTSAEKPVNAGDAGLLRLFREREQAVQRLAKRALDYHDALIEEGMEQLIADAEAVRAVGALIESDHVECTDSLCIWCEQDGSPREQRLTAESEAAAQPAEANPVNAGEAIYCRECDDEITTGLADYCNECIEAAYAAQPAEQKPVDGEHFYPYRTVDNALKHAEDEVEASDGWVRKTLAAEVSRLREELRHAQGLRSIMELKKRALEAEAERDQLKAELKRAQQQIAQTHKRDPDRPDA